MVFQAKVLEPLGANTSGSQFLEPDGNILFQRYVNLQLALILDYLSEFFMASGMFPNHIPNPEDKTAMKAIIQAVLDNNADLGIIFDTDVDRQ